MLLASIGCTDVRQALGQPLARLLKCWYQTKAYLSLQRCLHLYALVAARFPVTDTAATHRLIAPAQAATPVVRPGDLPLRHLD
jgi:hypothetical protein